jgi:hypothetical protein
MSTLRELYEKYNFQSDRDPKKIDRSTPSTLDIDIAQNKKWLKETPQIYGTDIVRIMSGGQIDKNKVRGVIGKIAGKSKLGGFVKKLIAPTAFKPSDLIENGKTVDPLYLGIEQNGSFGGSIIKSVKQFLKDNKTPQQISGNALGAGVGIAVDGLKLLGNKVLGKLGIGKTESSDPIDVRKISSVAIGKQSLIFPSTVVIKLNKNTGGVVANQEQNYFVDGIGLNDVFKKRITIGNNFKSTIDDEALGIESNKVISSTSYFENPKQYVFGGIFGNSGWVSIQDSTTYSELIKNEKYRGSNNKTNSKLLTLNTAFSHNITNKFLSIDSNVNEILVFSGTSVTKKTKLPSNFPLIGTLDGKQPDPKPKIDIYGQNNGGINNFSQSLLDSGRRVDQSYFGSGSINVNNQITTGTLVSNSNLSTASFAYTNNKDIYEGDSSTIGEVEKKIVTSKVLRQTYKTLKPVDVKLALPVYDKKDNAFLNKSKQSILSKAPQNLTVNIGGVSFPSTITNLQDTLTPNWDNMNPIGAGVPFYVFNNVEREITFKMTLYAENEAEVTNIKNKANQVGKLAWSRRNKYGAYGNIIGLKIGNLISQNGFLSSFTLAIDDIHPWDTSKELPMIISIDVTFKVATNNDTDSYNLYGDSPAPKLENQEVPGADSNVKKDDGAAKTASTTISDKKTATTIDDNKGTTIEKIITSTAVSPTQATTNTQRKTIGG